MICEIVTGLTQDIITIFALVLLIAEAIRRLFSSNIIKDNKNATIELKDERIKKLEDEISSLERRLTPSIYEQQDKEREMYEQRIAQNKNDLKIAEETKAKYEEELLTKEKDIDKIKSRVIHVESVNATLSASLIRSNDSIKFFYANSNKLLEDRNTIRRKYLMLQELCNLLEQEIRDNNGGVLVKRPKELEKKINDLKLKTDERWAFPEIEIIKDSANNDDE